MSGKGGKEGEGGGWVALFLLLIFLGIMVALLKSKQDVPIYRCPRCRRVVRRGDAICLFCGVPLVWHSSNPSGYKPELSEFIRRNAWLTGFCVLVASLIIYGSMSIACAYFPPANPAPIENMLAFLDRLIYVSVGYIIARPLEVVTSK